MLLLHCCHPPTRNALHAAQLCCQLLLQRVTPVNKQLLSPLTCSTAGMQLQQRLMICRSSKSSETSSSSSGSADPTGAGSSEAGVMPSALNAALLALWACLLGYVFVLAPNQTPSIDSFVVQKLCG